MGHRLITALTFLNAMALLACLILVAAATANDATKIKHASSMLNLGCCGHRQ